MGTLPTPRGLSADPRFARADFGGRSPRASISSYGNAITAMARVEPRMARDTEFVNPIHRFGTTTRFEAGVIRDTSRMAIDIVPLILLPTMDPERFERCSFSLQDAVSLLTITMTELPPFIIHFDKLRWHRVHAVRGLHAGAHPGLPDGGGRSARLTGAAPLRDTRERAAASRRVRCITTASISAPVAATRRSRNRCTRAARARCRALSPSSPMACGSASSHCG